ncbi:MAG: hypothetical protein SF182_27740 [Deltaproteobacteria bacterium]|nr:hypothetical protein [Deltaproteobacteria bacterium]
MALAAALLLGAGGASAESCSPAMCAGMSPLCWQAYQKIMVHKDTRVCSVEKCRDLAGDLAGSGSWVAVGDLTPKQALCACEAAFWSMDSDAQGLPDIDDSTQGGDNTSDDDE